MELAAICPTCGRVINDDYYSIPTSEEEDILYVHTRCLKEEDE